MSDKTIRKIDLTDNAALADIIRNALAEFNADKPGTVYFDETTDYLYELFQTERSIYYVAIFDNKIVGGAGIYPTTGLNSDTCELVKLYLSPLGRGKGLGRLLLEKCLQTAKDLAYQKVYLETMPELIIAVPMYEKFGFNYLEGPLGNSGHNGCNIWMIKEL